MVVTTTIAVTTTVIMTMTAITTMIMTMVATTTMTKNMTTTMTKNITTNMATIFKQVEKDNFYSLLKMITKIQEGYENSICTSSLKNRCFFITQPTKFIGSTLYY